MMCGCANLNTFSYETLLDEVFSSNVNVTNEQRKGYLYYLPKGMRIMKTVESNEILAKENIYYYLYVDRVSYYNKVKADYALKSDVVLSKKLENGDQFGYVEVKKTTNEKYFIEIMYNYAKIEVIVPSRKLEEALCYSASILSSIKYQDTVLKSLMEEDSLKANEMEYNIFETADTESGYLQIAEEYGRYEEKSESVDPDFIRR